MHFTKFFKLFKKLYVYSLQRKDWIQLCFISGFNLESGVMKKGFGCLVVTLLFCLNAVYAGNAPTSVDIIFEDGGVTFVIVNDENKKLKNNKLSCTNDDGDVLFHRVRYAYSTAKRDMKFWVYTTPGKSVTVKVKGSKYIFAGAYKKENEFLANEFVPSFHSKLDNLLVEESESVFLKQAKTIENKVKKLLADNQNRLDKNFIYLLKQEVLYGMITYKKRYRDIHAIKHDDHLYSNIVEDAKLLAVPSYTEYT